MIIQCCRRIAPAVFFAGILTAQAPFRTTTAGSEFKLEGHADDVPADDVFAPGRLKKLACAPHSHAGIECGGP
jgi:hypothetical protein